MSGSPSIFFIHSDTQQPVTCFEKHNTRITTETFQIMLTENYGPFSIKTSGFTSEFFVKYRRFLLLIMLDAVII